MPAPRMSSTWSPWPGGSSTSTTAMPPPLLRTAFIRSFPSFDPLVRESYSVDAELRSSGRRSGPCVLADLAERVAEGDADAAHLVGLEVSDEAGTRLAELLDGEDDPGLGVLVVVADGDRPRHRREVGVVGDHRVEVLV